MARLVVQTSEGIALSFDVAGIGSRTAAAAIDLALWGVFVLVATFVTTMLQLIDRTGVSQFLGGLVIGGILLSLILYHVAFATFWDGRTPGKALLGIRVRDVQGRPATLVQQLLRSLFLPVEIGLTIPVPLGIVVMAVTERGQRLGDLVAGTVVLRDARAAAPAEPFARMKWAELKRRRLGLSPALAARLDGEDLRFLRALLVRPNLEAQKRQRLFRRTAHHYAGVLGVEFAGPLDARESQEVLRELYLFLREQSRFLRETRP